MEMVVKEDNNRIKFTVHEALKDFDSKNNKTIEVIQDKMEKSIQKAEEGLNILLNQANIQIDEK